MSNSSTRRAIVTSASRRHVQLCTPEWQTLHGTVSSKALEITVGDDVEYEERNGQYFITRVIPARNTLSRSYRSVRKHIAHNLDHLCIVAAASPLFNTSFIDRVMTVCSTENIAYSLVVNKADLSFDDIQEALDAYTEIGVRILTTSAREGSGIDMLANLLATPSFRLVAFAGVSGVGKSSLLNTLLPGAVLETAEVSPKTGQGRRTTSFALAYRYERFGQPPLLLIDLPGVHNFGVEHLDREKLAGTFPEILSRRGQCQFLNCLHTVEAHCAIKDAVENGEIAVSRYQSYIDMLMEIEEARQNYGSRTRM